MEIVIIENKKSVANDLQIILKEIDRTFVVIKVLQTLKEAKTYFKNNTVPQLIFSATLLPDGSCLEMFKNGHLKAPLIYYSAFKSHTLQAFEHNGIAFIAKPFSKNNVKNALEKYQRLKNIFATQPLNYLSNKIETKPAFPQNLLINHSNKIIPIKISEIAFFISRHKITSLVTFQNQKYSVNHSLDELEEIAGTQFFRANRQFLINKTSVKDVLHYSLRKLFVNLVVDSNGEVVINKVKATSFLNWLKA